MPSHWEKGTSLAKLLKSVLGFKLGTIARNKYNQNRAGQ